MASNAKMSDVFPIAGSCPAPSVHLLNILNIVSTKRLTIQNEVPVKTEFEPELLILFPS
jgi:hypothetical protein